MFKNLRARLAAWIAPTTPTESTTPATTDNSITGGVHDAAKVVQARDIATLNTGDTHHNNGDTHHHNGTTNTINGDVNGGNVAMAHQVNGINQITGTTGNISWGNSGIINAGGNNTVTNNVINGRAGIQAGHVNGGTFIA